MREHEMKKGVCIHCGCDGYAIDYFGWSCCGRSIKHVYHNGVCLNCGFGKNVIDHFDWPCRLDSKQESGKNQPRTQEAWSESRHERAPQASPFQTSYQETGGTSAKSSSTAQHVEESTDGFSPFNRRFDTTYRRTYVSPYMDDETRFGRLLGLKGKVTKGEIKFAYREQANLYHPDRVAHLGPEFQELANEKMKEINKAFEYFQKKYDL